MASWKQSLAAVATTSAAEDSPEIREWKANLYKGFAAKPVVAARRAAAVSPAISAPVAAVAVREAKTKRY